MKYALVIGLITLLVSCKAGCPVLTKIGSGLAPGLSTVLKCKHPEYVKADLESAIASLSICKSNAADQGVVGMICAAVASQIIGSLGNKIPARWECDPTAVENGLEVAVSAACNLIPF
jgi:hypothetical protein